MLRKKNLRSCVFGGGRFRVRVRMRTCLILECDYVCVCVRTRMQVCLMPFLNIYCTLPFSVVSSPCLQTDSYVGIHQRNVFKVRNELKWKKTRRPRGRLANNIICYCEGKLGRLRGVDRIALTIFLDSLDILIYLSIYLAQTIFHFLINICSVKKSNYPFIYQSSSIPYLYIYYAYEFVN